MGHYDLITIAAGILAATTRYKSLIIMGAFMAVSANPEQAMMTSLCVAVFAMGSKEVMDKFIAKWWLLITFISYFSIHLIIGQANDGSRVKIFLDTIKGVSADSLGKINFIIFSVFGVGWAIIFLGSSQIMRISKLKFQILGAILMPVIFAIFVLDRTRVGVAIGTLPVLLLLKLIARELKVEEISNRVFSYLLIVIIFTPQIFIDSDGTLRLPYSEFIKHFVV
jgi:hypothetical protein